MQNTEKISVNPVKGSLAELQKEINRLELELAEMKNLSTNLGFFNAYFGKLKSSKSFTDAFQFVNEKYFSLFGRYRYSSYDTFCQMTHCYGN